MALLPLLQLSSGEEWLWKVAAKVTVQGLGFLSFFFCGSVPIAIVFQSKAHLYMLWYGLRNHANSVGVV